MNKTLFKKLAIFNILVEATDVETTPTGRKVQYVYVSPALAREFLNHSEGNLTRAKSINQNDVEKYARMMAAGQWNPEDESPFGFRMVNGKPVFHVGHHRMHAIVQYGKPVLFRVTWNMNPKSEKTTNITRGYKFGDTFREKYAGSYKSFANGILDLVYGKGRKSATEFEIEEVIDKCIADLKWLIPLVNKRHSTKGADISLACYFGLRHYKREVIESFLDGVHNVNNRNTDEPTYRLRWWRDKTGVAPYLALALSALTLHADGKTTSSLRALKQEEVKNFIELGLRKVKIDFDLAKTLAPAVAVCA